MLALYQNIKNRRLSLGLSQTELAELTGYTDKTSISKIENGLVDLPQSKIVLFAKALKTTCGELMGYDDNKTSFILENIIPMPNMHKVPLVGTIACGEPILAEENLEGEADLPEHIHADFALRCKGDSMINARIYDGDIVYIRQQPTVEDGEIAAVLIGDEATLKRVRFYEDHVVLEPENPLYRPLSYWGEEMSAIRILGKAVAFTSKVR